MQTPKVTILIPNYKTPELTKLCLRLLRKYTNPALAHIIVVDNDSQDDSLIYLRQLPWIELIERLSIPGETGPAAHAHALDLAMTRVTTPYVLSIHTDTLVKCADWLEFLLAHIEGKPQIAGVGSWKLESKSWVRRAAKTVERNAQAFYSRLFNKNNSALAAEKNYYYLRSHCALYRTDLLRKFNLMFADSEAVAGKVLHKKLIDNGYEMIFLTSEELGQHVDHINHATMILNPQLGAREKTIKQGKKQLQQRLQAVQADDILRDGNLDR
jgi:GT2 family glycosyltransferase